LSTREKILVGLMLVAVCLGSLMLFSDGQKKQGPSAASDKPNSITHMLTNLATQFGSNTLLEQKQYVLSMARTPWQDIFLTGDAMMAQPVEALISADMLPSNVSLVYSGYIETPQRRVAIINGIEYLEGELLDKSQLVIRHIDSQRVVLGASAHKVFSVPLVDDGGAQTP
jgi:hypothetical protein